MTSDDLRFLLSVASSFGGGALLAAGIAYLLLRNYFAKYFEEKGRNLATLEDIDRITRKVEEVKAAFSAKERLRFAAMDRRLQAHQEAYGLSRRLAIAVQDRTNDLLAIVAECSEWFNANALYLEEDARHSFYVCWFAASVHRNYERDEGDEGADRRANWQKIVRAQDEIAKCVGLPPLVEEGSAT